MRIVGVMLITGLAITGGAWAQKPPLLPEKDVAALANEISGETAKRNLEGIARFHRQRGSKGFHEAAELVAERLRAYGLSDVTILQFPADGKIFYGTQRSRPAWDAEFAELQQVVPDIVGECVESKGEKPGERVIGCGDRVVDKDYKLLASYEVEPIVLAEDSESADVTADLVDVGEGTKESDYAGKNVKGKIVLVSAQPGAVQDLAIGKFGAVGIVSYAQNQKTAWWGENQDAIRWGHLESFSSNKTFGFMVSLRMAHVLKARLEKGEKITLHAVVKAGQHPGHYEVVTATIPGADPKLGDEEIAFSCHLDHQRPGANDNASGCATILEVARTLQKLIGEGNLARPARTIRFVFPPEIEGTMALLNAKPELAKRIKVVVHMDMVGGGPETKAVFHVTRGPMSLPSFVQDVAWAFAEWVNEESYEFAATGKAAYPLISPEGGKEPLRAEYSAYTMGSDHDVYQDSSFGIPAIYLNDWPDRFIHTNLDTPANIDPTKLKRVALIGAASGYFLAGKHEKSDPFPLVYAVRRGRVARDLLLGQRWMQHEEWARRDFSDEDSSYLGAIRRSANNYIEDGCLESAESKCPDLTPVLPQDPVRPKKGILEDRKPEGKYVRTARSRGPLTVFGYDYFAAEWAKRGHTTKPKLMEFEGLWGEGEEYAYEVLNFADGKRTALQIRDAVSAEYGLVGLDLVVEYLKALEEIEVVEELK